VLLRALSKCPLNADRLGASTTSPGSLCQCLATLSVKKRCLMSSLNLPRCSFEPFPRIPSLDPREKSSPPPSPLQYFNTEKLIFFLMLKVKFPVEINEYYSIYFS